MPRRRKSDPNSRARSSKSYISPARDAAVRKWLKKSAARVAANETQRKLHTAAEPCIGTLSGGHASDAKSIRRVMQQRLKSRYGR